MRTTTWYQAIKQTGITAAFIGCCQFAHAQDSSRYLPLDAALAQAKQHNISLQQSHTATQLANAQYQQTSAFYLPKVAVSYTGFTTNNPLNAFGFKLQQQTVAQNDFNPALLNNPGNRSDFSTRLDLQQAVVNPALHYLRKAAATQVQVLLLQEQRSEEYLQYEVRAAYLQLQLAYKMEHMLDQSLVTATALQQKATHYAGQGLIQRSDVLNAAVLVNQVNTQLANARSNIANASDYLGILMGSAAGTIYQCDSLVAIQPGDAMPENAATTNSADLLALQKAVEASSFMVAAAKKSRLPTVHAFANYQLNDRRVAGFGAGSYFAGIQLNWVLFNGNQVKNTIATRLLEHQQMQQQFTGMQQQQQLAVRKAHRELIVALQTINHQQLSVQQATEALNILQNRYAQGLVQTTDVLQATSQLSQQQFALASAQYQAQLAKAYLQFLQTSHQ